MADHSIYKDIAERTGGDIYIGVVGPVRSGKSTFIKRFMESLVLPNMGEGYSRERARDEMPQSAAGKTVMTTEPKFVPAKAADIPLTDRIFTRVGASDNLIFDQSTFMVEMTEVATILRHATKDSLLILDEVGRGTSTYDGLSIAWSVVEFLAEKTKAKTLFATHYHELTELEKSMKGVKNYKITVKEVAGSVVFLRKIVRGGANRSFGIEVASLAGVPKEVTVRAKTILKNLERKELSKGTLQEFVEIEEEIVEEKQVSKVEEILMATDVNTLSPMQALLLLNDLKGKLETEN